MTKKQLYLDHAATSPMRPEVAKLISQLAHTPLGNPSSTHTTGRQARALIDKARNSVARMFDIDPQAIVFTGSGSESNNLALHGVMRKYCYKGRLIISAIEHPSIYNTAHVLQSLGVDLKIVPVNKQGIIDLKKLASYLTPTTRLVSIMYVNNEIGTVQPVAEIAKLIANFNKTKKTKVLFHTDAVQGAGYLKCYQNYLKADLISVSAHKLGGPVGAGILVIKPGVSIKRFIVGGHQEHNLRAGTENVLGIAGSALAIELANKHRDKEAGRLNKLRELIIKQIKRHIPNAIINGDTQKVAPHIVSVSIPGLKGEDIVINCDRQNIMVSAGSACNAGAVQNSRIIESLHTVNPDSAVRISLGWNTNEIIVKDFVKQFVKIVGDLMGEE